jgi:hypothetical protein
MIMRGMVVCSFSGEGFDSTKGLVTLATKERDGSATLEISGSRDCLAPRAHRRGAECAMRWSGSEVALDVESVEDGSVSGEKSLRWARALETLHLALTASGRLMRILGAVVLPPTALMAGAHPKIMRGGGIRAQIVSDQSIWDEPAFLQEFTHQFQRGILVSLALDQHVKDLALGVDGAPQMDHAAGNLEINLVKMPGWKGLGRRLRKSAAIIGPKWFTQRRTDS